MSLDIFGSPRASSKHEDVVGEILKRHELSDGHIKRHPRHWVEFTETSAAQDAVFKFLRNNPGALNSEIAKATGLGRGRVLGIVQRACAKGVMARRRDAKVGGNIYSRYWMVA